MKTNDELQKDVMEELRWDPQLRDLHTLIGVAVKDGVVTLSGTLTSYTKKLAAEKAAQKVRGVKVVASDIAVKLTTTDRPTDAEIGEAIKTTLRWDSALTQEKIDIKVDNGWVYLEGEVEWAYQKDSIQTAIESLTGVTGIKNNITIKNYGPVSVDIKKKISEAFIRNSSLDANAITITTADSTVILKGVVRSWAERQEAEKVAWSSPGVKNVNNLISVDTEIYAE